MTEAILQTGHLFDDSEDVISPVITIPPGGRIVFVGFNFEDDMAVEFDVVLVEANKPNTDACCLPDITLPGVKKLAPVVDCCTAARLTACSPIVVITQPEGFGIRAIRNKASKISSVGYRVIGIKK